MTTLLTAPKKAKYVAYGEVNFGVNPDGTVTVPDFCVPDLLLCGCSVIAAPEGMMKALQAEKPDVRGMISDAADHELSIYLNSQGVADHYWDKLTHIFSDDLRKLGKLFTHGDAVTTTLTIDADGNYTSTEHNLLPGAEITCDLVPAGTTLESVLPPLKGDTGVRGVLALPDGAKVKAGTATAIMQQHVSGDTLADHLDDYHERFHAKKEGRIVILSREQKLAKALAIHDAQEAADVAVAEKPVV